MSVASNIAPFHFLSVSQAPFQITENLRAKRVSELVFSRWGLGLTALFIGIGACYGAPIALGVTAIAAIAIYSLKSHFLTEIETAATKGNIEKIIQLLKANSNSSYLTPDLLIRILRKLLSSQQRNLRMTSLNFLVEHPIFKTWTAESQSLHQQREVFRVISLVMREKNNDAVLYFQYILKSWSPFISDLSISHLFREAGSLDNPNMADVLLHSNRAQNIAIEDMKDLIQVPKSDEIAQRLLIVFLSQADADFFSTPQNMQLRNYLTQRGFSKAVSYWDICHQFVDAVRIEDSDLANKQIYLLSDSGNLTPLWLKNAFRCIYKQGAPNELIENTSSTMLARWNNLPEKNIALVVSTIVDVLTAERPSNRIYFQMVNTFSELSTDHFILFLNLAIERNVEAIVSFIIRELNKEHLPILLSALEKTSNCNILYDLLYAIAHFDTPPYEESLRYIHSRNLNAQWISHAKEAYQSLVQPMRD